MLKGRIGLWCLMLAVTLLVSWLMGVVPGWFESNALSVDINVSTDSDFAQVLANQKINHIEPILSSNEPMVIITDSNEDIAGYKKYENYLYSPIVVWACGAYNKESGFIKVPQVSNTFKIDLYSVLTAIESDKQWQDLGFDKTVVNGAVKLTIPGPQCAYYENVIDLFVLTLNNGTKPTAEQRVELMTRVQAIIAKCEIVADIMQAIRNEYEQPSDTHKMFIGPEYIYQRSSGYAIGYGNENSKQYRPIYLMNTTFVTTNVFVKDSGDNIDLANKFIKEMQTKKAFIAQTGWRVQNIEFDIWNISYAYYKNP